VMQLERGDRAAVRAFLELLSGWLYDHMRLTDRMMASQLRSFDRAHRAKAS
jgi:hemerythrin